MQAARIRDLPDAFSAQNKNVSLSVLKRRDQANISYD